MGALGGFPSYIHPFVFSYPSGSTMGYPFINKLSHSETLRKQFILALDSLRRAGIRTVNIMTHSMGGRVFANCIRDLEELDDILIRKSSNCERRLDEADDEKMELAT